MNNNRILEIKLSRAFIWKRLIKQISNILPKHCVIIFGKPSGCPNCTVPEETPIGIHISQLSDDKSLLCNVILDADKFEYFCCDVATITAGIDIKALNVFLQYFSYDDPLWIYMNQNNPNSLYFRGLNETTKCETNIEYKLIALDVQPLFIPNAHFQTHITMLSKEFYRITAYLHKLLSFVQIQVINDVVHFKGTNENVTIDISFPSIAKTNPQNIVIQNIYDARSLYQLHNCKDMCKTIEIYMKENFPLVLQIPIWDLGKMTVYLSPVLDNLNEDIDGDAYEDIDED